MALIKCYECEKEISDSAAACPHCGAPVKDETNSAWVDTVEDERQVSFLLVVGIVVLPVFFVWFLLRNGYSKSSRIWGFGYLILSILFFTYSGEKETQTTLNETQETTVITANDESMPGRPAAKELNVFTAQNIADAYESNTVAADRQFKNKWLIVSGKVDSINTDVFDDAYVTLAVDNRFNGPQAKFIKTEEDKLAGLKNGQDIKAICLGNGDVVKTPMLIDCALTD